MIVEAQVGMGNGSQNVNNTNVGYTGHQWDNDTGLNYMQARYYDPLLARFMSNDPVGFSNTHNFNRYVYAANNPYKYTDPDDRDIKAVVVVVVAACAKSKACRKAAKDIADEAKDIWKNKPKPNRSRPNQKKFKEKVWENNKKKNDGEGKCENCGKDVEAGKKLDKGDKVPNNRGEAHHKERKADGGSDDADKNGELLCNPCHIDEYKP
jgi:RHS repeat-associated protein